MRYEIWKRLGMAVKGHKVLKTVTDKDLENYPEYRKKIIIQDLQNACTDKRLERKLVRRK